MLLSIRRSRPQRGRRAVDDSRERDGQQGPGDAQQQPAGSRCAQDHERMQPESSPHDERLQDVPFKLLHDGERDDRIPFAVEDERDGHGDPA